MYKRIAIVGAGAGGSTLAVHLAQLGLDVVLVELPGFTNRLETIKRAQWRLETYGMLDAHTTVRTGTWSAIKECDVVFVTTVADAHAKVARLLADQMCESVKAVVYFPGNAGSLFLESVLKAREISHKPRLVEANSLPYGCRVDSENPCRLRVSVLTPKLLFSGDADHDPDLWKILTFLSPDSIGGGTVESTFLSNPNPLFHPTPCLLSASRIELADGNFYMYTEGVIPSVLRVLQAKDAERRRLLKAAKGRWMKWGELRGIVDVEGVHNEFEFLECGRRGNFRGPDSLEHRYIVEDTAAGLVSWERIGQIVKVETPIVSAEITLIGTLLHRNFRALGKERADLIASCHA